LNTVETSVLVIGAGAAGSMAAIKASEFTNKILVLEKAVLRSCGNLAMGHHSGELNPMTNVPGGPTSEQFVEGYLNSSSGWSGIERPLDKYIIAEEFPAIVRDLEKWGLEIYKNPDGSYASYWEKFIGERMESGVEIKGGTMKKCLISELKRRNIEVVERTMAVDLLTRGNAVVGVVGLNIRTGELTAYRSKSVVMCTGSSSRTYIVSPGRRWFWMRDVGTNSGDGRGMCYRAGAEMTMMELVRTDHLVGNTMGRYWGGKMINWKGEEFLRETYAKRWGRLWSMHLEILKGNAPLYWDATGLSEEKMKKRNAYASYEKHQPDIYLPESYRQRGLKPSRDKVEANPIPIGFLGGADFKSNGGTSIEGLYAAGDEIWMDSLSGAFVFARRAGEAAAKYSKQIELKSVDRGQLRSIEETVLAPSKRSEGIHPTELEEKVRNVLTRYANVGKSEGTLRHGLGLIKELRDRVLTQLSTRNPHELMRAAEVRNIMDVAEMHMAAALYRTETVPYGRHFHHRIDYPTQHPSWYRQRVVIKREAGEMRLFKRETTEQRVPTLEEYLAVKEIKP
jgi:succinate dehydrogenase/fumarate reductase flavoprotein subunit